MKRTSRRCTPRNAFPRRNSTIWRSTFAVTGFVVFGLLHLQSVQADEFTETHNAQVTICRLNLATGKNERMFVVPQIDAVDSLAISKDGQHLAIAGTSKREPMPQDCRIWSYSTDGTNATNLGKGSDPTWSPRGQRLAYTKRRVEPGVWVMHADGSNEQLIDHAGHHVQWAPNGRMLAYIRTAKNRGSIVIFNPVEDEYRRILPRDYGVVPLTLAWSQDSRHIAFSAQENSGQSIVASLAITGDSQPAIHHRHSGRAASALCWAQEPTVIATLWSKPHNANQLLALNVAGQPSSVVERLDGQSRKRSNSNAVVASAGDYIIYASTPISTSNDVP